MAARGRVQRARAALTPQADADVDELLLDVLVDSDFVELLDDELSLPELPELPDELELDDVPALEDVSVPRLSLR